MKLKLKLIGTTLLTVASVAMLATQTGCLLSHTATVTPGGTNSVTGVYTGPVTNTVTTVNEANLALDSAALEAVASIAVSTVVSKDPSVIPVLKNAHTILDGILNGSNPQTTAQVLAMLKAQNNPTLTSEVNSLIGAANTLEQSLLAKYGQGVAGEITMALAKAINAGLATGLAGK